MLEDFPIDPRSQPNPEHLDILRGGQEFRPREIGGVHGGDLFKDGQKVAQGVPLGTNLSHSIEGIGGPIGITPTR